MEHFAVIENVSSETLDVWVYPRNPQGARSIFGDLVFLRGAEPIPAAVARLRQAGWRVMGEWRREGDRLVADVAGRA